MEIKHFEIIKVVSRDFTACSALLGHAVSLVSLTAALAAAGASSAGVKVASARLPSPKTLVGSPAQILAQFPKQQSPKQLQHGSALGISQTQTSSTSPGSKPTIQIKQESGKPPASFTLSLSFLMFSFEVFIAFFFSFLSLDSYLFISLSLFLS